MQKIAILVMLMGVSVFGSQKAVNSAVPPLALSSVLLKGNSANKESNSGWFAKKPAKPKHAKTLSEVVGDLQTTVDGIDEDSCEKDCDDCRYYCGCLGSKVEPVAGNKEKNKEAQEERKEQSSQPKIVKLTPEPDPGSKKVKKAFSNGSKK